MIELKAKVYGRVHGVGFRATTAAFAHELGLKGTVRNCADGTVEIIAQGGRKEVEELIAKLRNVFGKLIVSIDMQITKAEKLFSEFSVF